MYRGKPYCMSQYKKGGCRIPGKDVDSVRSNFPPECRHVIIIRKGHVSIFVLVIIQLLSFD